MLQIEKDTIMLADAFEYLAALPDASVDVILTDPPYYRIVAEEWDNQWESLTDFQEWVRRLAAEFRRVLRSHGSLYWFCDDKVAAYCQTVLDERFHLINSLVWEKPATLSCLSINSGLRSFAICTERILFYEQKGASGLPATGLEAIHSRADCFASIKAYMRNERAAMMKARGWSKLRDFEQWVNEVTKTSSKVSRHCWADSQYEFPTEAQYRALQSGGFFRREYEDLRREYEDLRHEYEDLRRPWNNDKRAREILTFPPAAPPLIHPTQKPVGLLTYLLQRSTRPGFTVLDPFSGSGSTAAACYELGLTFLGCECSPTYHAAANVRLRALRRQPLLF